MVDRNLVSTVVVTSVLVLVGFVLVKNGNVEFRQNTSGAATIDARFELYRDGKIDNRDVKVITTAIKNNSYSDRADLNKDKKVNFDDLALLREYMYYDLPAAIGETQARLTYFDFNLDKVIDNKDVQLLANVIKAETNDPYYYMISLNDYNNSRQSLDPVVDFDDVSMLGTYVYDMN